MSQLESGRKLGLISSLIAVITPVIGVVAYVLLILSIIAGVGVRANSTFPVIILIAVIGITAIAGFILFIIAMHRLSQYYNEPGIFKNTLYGFIINIVGGIAFTAIYFALLGNLIGSIPSSSTQTTVATPIPTIPPIVASLEVFILSFFAIIGVALVLGIVSAVFYMRAFNKLGEKSGLDNFKTAGLLYLIGIVLSIVGIGIVLVWIAWIFALIGFHSLKPKAAETSTFPYPQPQATIPNTTQTKRCPYCGTENDGKAIYCMNCGKQIQ